MELYIWLPTNLKIFKLFVENKDYILWWNSKTEKEVANFFMKNFPWEVMEVLSPQYETNFLAIRKLKSYDKDIFNKIKWIYWGSDNCEYLAPTKKEIEEAYNLFIESKKKYGIEKFIVVTPYVWEKMYNRLTEGLDFLNSLKVKQQIEIVVNDYWILDYIETNCKNLKIILGKLLHKQLKTPLVDTFWNNAHVSWEKIKNKDFWTKKELQKVIIENQNKFYNDLESTFSPFQRFIKKHNISRLTMDLLWWERKELYSNKENYDLHYPFSLIFTGRLCDTSSLEQPERWNYAIDDICPRTCERFDIFYKIKTQDYKLIQRWNSWYRIELELDRAKDFFNWKDNRLIFTPFI